MLAKFRTYASGVLFSWGDSSSYRFNIPWVRCASGNVFSLIGQIGLQVERPLWQGKFGKCVTGLSIGIGQRLTVVANTKVQVLKILNI